MALTLQELEQRLDALDAAMPALLNDYRDPGDLMEAFAGLAEPIADAAGAQVGHVRGRLTGILQKHREAP